MDKLDIKEKIWGLIFGIIAIISAVVEMISGGISWTSFFGMLKDIAGTAVVIIVGVAFINHLPKKANNPNGIIQTKLDAWCESNVPLIFKVEEGFKAPQDTNYSQGYWLLQNPKEYTRLIQENLNPKSPDWKKYTKYSGSVTGKFLEMPDVSVMTSQKFNVLCYMGQSHFDSNDYIDIIQKMIHAVNNRFSKFEITAIKGKSNKEFLISYNPLITEEQIDTFISSLDFILSMVKVVM